MAGVRLHDVTKRFGEVVALDRFSIDIEDGEFVVFVGPSGCGKTTALRIVAGLESATDGNIHISDGRVNDVPPKDRDVAMVFQSYALYPHMTVYDNMAFGLRIRLLRSYWWQLTHMAEAKQRREEIDQHVRSTAEMLGLGDLLGRRPKELSGGQRQRVALGRAIVRKPRVFLMDEPLSNLDAKLRAQTRAELIRLHRQLGVTTIYVTHDQTEAMTMGDRIAVMKDGVLQQVGTPADVFHSPINAFVASFIGTPPMNLLEVPVSDGSAQLGDGAFACPVQADSITLGFRPESVRPGGDGIPFSATVDVVEPLGSTKNVTLNLDGHEILVTLPEDVSATSGETLQLNLRPNAVHFFDKETGEAVR